MWRRRARAGVPRPAQTQSVSSRASRECVIPSEPKASRGIACLHPTRGSNTVRDAIPRLRGASRRSARDDTLVRDATVHAPLRMNLNAECRMQNVECRRGTGFSFNIQHSALVFDRPYSEHRRERRSLARDDNVALAHDRYRNFDRRPQEAARVNRRSGQLQYENR